MNYEISIWHYQGWKAKGYMITLRDKVIFNGTQESNGTPINKLGTIVMMCLEQHEIESKLILYKVICEDGSNYITTEKYLIK